MKNQPIVVVVEGGFMQTALKLMIQNYTPDYPIAFHNSIEDCLNGKTCPRYLVIDVKLIPNPIAYTLEKMRNKNPDGQIMLIESGCLEDSARSYADEVLNRNDSEEIISRKLKKYLEKTLNSGTASTNDSLSDREKEIVQLVALGKTNKEISEKLFISPHTVITHRKNITAKLGIKTIAGITVYAILNDLIDKDDLSGK